MGGLPSIGGGANLCTEYHEHEKARLNIARLCRQENWRMAACDMAAGPQVSWSEGSDQRRWQLKS